MTEITDEYMREMLGKSKTYTLVLLRPGVNYTDSPEVEAVIWEHGRRNFSLRNDGALSIVGPVTDDSDLSGIAIFPGNPEDVAGIMDTDPGVAAGVFTYELHPIRSFPGDALR